MDKAHKPLPLPAGVYKISLGRPEEISPLMLREGAGLPLQQDENGALPQLLGKRTARGYRVEHILAADEELFGFGLQLKAVAHKGGTKTLRVNADPVADSGDSHAPVPLVISSRGYGLLFCTLRNIELCCGAGKNKHRPPEKGNETTIAVEDLYAKTRLREATTLVAEIPAAEGVEVYYFAGGDVGGVVRLYNLFSGGGCMPPLWGLGPQLRCFARYNQQQVLHTARHLRQKGIPCTMLGLEPGWQTHSYACSLAWDKAAFEDPPALLAQLTEMGFHLNLWQHAFLSADSPLYPVFEDYSGEYEVWKGLVPDFATPEGARLFTDYHKKTFVEIGVDGFKLDECDGSDFTGGWSYPNSTVFPSGMDGEQMHHAFGQLYQKAVLAALGGEKRTLSLARSSGSFAAPLPFVLYSDLYGHEDFVRGMVNAGYSGLLWAPEVRDADSGEAFLRRVETAVFSAFALVNGWYMPQLPWDVWGKEQEVKALFELRMALVPYLYAAYYAYRTRGVPPVKGLPYAYADDRETHTIADEYLFGDDILVAPILAGQSRRAVYLPAGEWYDFWTGRPVAAGRHTVCGGPIPAYVKGGTILPLAAAQPCLSADTCFTLNPVCYGDCAKAVCWLVEDDGISQGTAYSLVGLTQNGLQRQSFRYRLGAFSAAPPAGTPYPGDNFNM